MRDAAVMVGNSSSGIIEAASFGTPVLDVGPPGRSRAEWERRERARSTKQRSGRCYRASSTTAGRGGAGPNVYGGDGAGRRIAAALARMAVNDRLLRKLIAY